ncbi:hypothetical protein [Pantoea agglomerans]|uniref:hypothetical protein n=1 Tax=Enterobacter agglomerans TaxID=549 RepID=UPI001CCB3F6D|nr:hypothetical protein [Pantoea agglomerans]UBN55673.1 hypothetical protein LB453_09065 [Pantoea agglomerans]
MKLIPAVCTFLCILFGLMSIGYSVLKNKQHNKLCEAFKKKFGYLPAGIILAQAGGLFSSIQKDFYFIFPLIVKKGSFAVRNMNPDHYDFIKYQPKEMTSWLKVKFTLFLLAAIFFFATIVTSYLFE